jgi:phage protein D
VSSLLSGSSSTTSTQIHVQVNGMDLPPNLSSSLLSVEVDSTMHLPSQVKLVFQGSPSKVLDPPLMLLASPISVQYQPDVEADRTDLFKGEITALEADVSHGHEYTIVRGMDKSHRLMRGTKTKAYQEMTASGIVEELVDSLGLVPNSDSTTPPYTVLGQANVSDWVFIQQLAALSNRVAYTDGVGGFNFVKPPTTDTAPPAWTSTIGSPPISGQLVLGQNLTQLRMVVSAAEQVPTVSARGWDPSEKQAVVGESTPSTTMLDSEDSLASPATVAGEFGGGQFTITSVPFTDQSRAATFAQSVMSSLSNSMIELEGEVYPGDPSLVAGTAVSVGNAGDPFNGKYVVTGAKHVNDPNGGGYSTWVTVSGLQDRSLYALSSGGNGGGWTRPTIPGIVTATVSSVKDPEQKGRVQLSFPWLDDTYVSGWARVLQIGSGSGWGNIFMPEVNSEVLVGFERGNIDQPYVIGGLYNGQDTIAPNSDSSLVDDGTGAINQRLIQSRTKHLILFNDDVSKQKQGITIKTAAGQLLQFNDGASPATITITGNGDIKISTQGNVTITATQNLSLEGQQQLSLKSKQIQISADSQLQVSSSGTAQISANGTMQISGSMTSINS